MENSDLYINNNPILIGMLILFEILLLRETYHGWRFTDRVQNKTIVAWENAPRWWPFRELSIRYYKSKFYFWFIRIMPFLWLLIISTILLVILAQYIIK
jgi:hypothetical protein